MKINSTQLLESYEAARTFVHEDSNAIDLFQNTEQIFESKKATADALIMVYGVYNAGKSTLINALLGREAAETDDIPTTDKVTSYQWGQYSILDTPGVDAPIEHENITKEEMLNADAIIFVVDPVGTAEEAKTLSIMLDLLQDGKQVFLVFNEKKAITEEDFIKLKDQTRLQLQKMATERGLREILKGIPIVKINAKRAVQGHIKQQPKLVELSGLPLLERQLQEFLLNISSDDIYGRLKLNLVSFLKDYVAILNNSSSSDIVKKYDKLLRSISTEKSRLRLGMRRELRHTQHDIYEKSKLTMRTNAENSQAVIEKLLQDSSAGVCEHLTHELQVFVNTIQEEIEEFQASIPEIVLEQDQVVMPEFETENAAPRPQTGIEAPSINSELFTGAAEQVAHLVKPAHIVSGLKLVKDALPSLMKGIGIKTMEKWATAATSRFIPYIGPAIAAGEAIYSIFAEDPEVERLQKQHDEQQLLRERAQQQTEDFAREISENFEASMQGLTSSEIETFFDNVTSQVDALRKNFSDTEQANSQRIERLLEIQQVAINA